MKKILKQIGKNRKFIFSFSLILILIGVLLIFSNSLYAATNPQFYNPPKDFEKWFGNIMSNVLDTGLGVLGKPLSLILNLVNVLLFILMYSIFVPSGVANGYAFPFPDQIIFNGVAMLDPNFINPVDNDTAIVNIMSSIVQKMYYSFFTLAGTVFILAAVIIGIKLAFSSIASEKAQYKDAIKHWIIGLGALFLMHFVLAGMFAINEQICIAASKLCSQVKIKIDAFSLLPGVGSMIRGVLKIIGSIFGNSTEKDFIAIEVEGYGGLILKFVVEGILQGDLVYSIGLAIMLGQTFSLILMYLKRVFYCIILGMVAPLVVAMDTIQKVVTGKDTGILKNWFQNMVAIIFNQSFQAIFLCVSIIIIGEIGKVNTGTNTDMLEAIVAVVALNAIMKFDKLFKELLGIKDSKIMGGFNENAMRSFSAIKSGMSLARRSAEPFKKRGEAKIRYNDAVKKRNKALNNLSELNKSGNPASPGGSTSSATQTSTNVTNNSTGISGVGNGGSAADNAQMIAAMNNLSRALESNTSAKNEEKREKLNEELANAEAEMTKARADQRAESLRAFTRFGTTLGSVGFGYGATDNFGDAVSVGNLVDIPMDAVTDRAVNRGVYGNASRKFDSKRNELTNKYINSGLSQDAARQAADKAIANIQSQLNNEIPEAIGHMVKDVSTEAVKGAVDVASRKGKKYSKEVRKKLYSSDKIDNI